MYLYYVFMYCEESNPKTEIKEIGGNVYLDSALEFFCDFRPEKQKGSAINYINLEMNCGDRPKILKKFVKTFSRIFRMEIL